MTSCLELYKIVAKELLSDESVKSSLLGYCDLIRVKSSQLSSCSYSIDRLKSLITKAVQVQRSALLTIHTVSRKRQILIHHRTAEHKFLEALANWILLSIWLSFIPILLLNA
jgi:hypothetical protein